jgi:pyruvate,orthophosphate dikinase
MGNSKYVYLFEEGNAQMRDILGGKGANLAEMRRIGLPVPPGFTVSTEACNDFFKNGKQLSLQVKEQILEGLKVLEAETGKIFGDKDNPLLVSVRSGAVVSMPGMMDTVLNLGLNDTTVSALAKKANNERFALDCYRRFIQMFGDVVMRIPSYKFENILSQVKEKYGAEFDTQLSAEGLKEVAASYKEIVKSEMKQDFPQDPFTQLMMAVEAVFNSWDNQRAKIYRQINKIPDHLGTAVNVQSMVFGNLGNTSGTGVAFTRNPSTGENNIYGEYLVNAQGEDVVAGIRTPRPITQMEKDLPEAYQALVDTCRLLEKHYRDMQDIEFTIEEGKLYLLQTRTGKRTAAAAVKIAVDMVKDGVISEEEALLRVQPEQIVQLLHSRIDPDATVDVIAKGLPASPGAACGAVVFDADDAADLGKNGRDVILVRTETTPDDIHGIIASRGVLTSRGGMTSHAAVVARGMGKPCICGCEQIKINLVAKEFTVGDRTIKEGEIITIDGATGRVMLGEVGMIEPTLSGDFAEILSWADKHRRLRVRANADNPTDAEKAREFGAEGIGLCRTEHMFMDQDRVPVVQEMILADTDEEREIALNKLLPMQQGDFEGIFRVMDGLSVNIRLLDPPLHEFLPNGEELTVEVRTMKLMGEDPVKVKQKENILRKVKSLSELNPMLGHRGVRLGLVHPDIYKMQVRAIGQAAVKVSKEGVKVSPEIMIPLIVHANELKIMRELIIETMEEVMEEAGVKIPYTVGTMIEAPRACVTADQIVDYADYFSFGTNDLTQTTFGFSRDDAEGKFLHFYVEHKILEENPFAVLDQEGVGKLVKMATELGRSKKPNLKVGICGEHGGEPSTIEFLHHVGLNYVSCSPFRVPIARLAAAQAAIKEKRVNGE